MRDRRWSIGGSGAYALLQEWEGCVKEKGERTGGMRSMASYSNLCTVLNKKQIFAPNYILVTL